MSRTTHTGLVVRRHNDDLIVSICIDYSSPRRYTDAYIKCSGNQASFYKPGDSIEIQCDLAEPVEGTLALHAHFITHNPEPKQLEEQLELTEESATGFSADQLKLMQRMVKQAVKEANLNE